MTDSEPVPLLVGEIFVDFMVTAPGTENKLRLGGIAHAARGFWARRMRPAWRWRSSPPWDCAWDGARGGMILVGILCSLMATFPRPLMAAQSYARGLGLALVVSAFYQFMLVPTISDF